MSNPYGAPRSNVGDVYEGENNSGGGSEITPPPGVAGWSWGAFLISWIWAIFNRTWIGLLALVPYVGILVSIYLGIKGRELAWRNKRWESLEHFNDVQRRWSLGSAAGLGNGRFSHIGGDLDPESGARGRACGGTASLNFD